MNPKTDKIVRRTTMVATGTASYFLLTADYGPEPNVLDPIKNAILSAQDSMKEFVFGSKKEEEDTQMVNSTPTVQKSTRSVFSTGGTLHENDNIE